MSETSKSKLISFWLDHDATEKLDFLAKKTKRSRAFFIREAILKYLEDLEDTYYGEEALRAIAEGKEDLLSHDEVWRELDR